MELNAIIERLPIQGDMWFKDGASPKEVSEFEKVNHVQLPDQYKEWLTFSDGGELFLPGGIHLDGVSHKPIIDVDDNDRPNDHYVVIGCLCNGDPIVFERGKEAIAIYNHTAGQIEEDELYPDLASFLNDLPNILGLEVNSNV